MEIILTENVEELGSIGDVVNVKPGYARNYLLPKGLALAASQRNVKELDHRKRQLERKLQKVTEAAELHKKQIEKTAVVLTHRAGEEGKLFGSVGTADIARALTDSGTAVERHEVRLPEGAFRVVGEHDVLIQLHTDVDVTIKLLIEAD